MRGDSYKNAGERFSGRSRKPLIRVERAVRNWTCRVDLGRGRQTDPWGWQGWGQIGADWFPNGTNLGLFKIRFSAFWRGAPKCTESDLKKSPVCPIWGKFNPAKPKCTEPDL